jgi:hypothetical protein
MNNSQAGRGLLFLSFIFELCFRTLLLNKGARTGGFALDMPNEGKYRRGGLWTATER